MNQDALRTFRSHLRDIERHVAGALKEQTSCCGVTMAQCHVLLEFDADLILTNIELSDRLGLDTSTLSRTVDSLVKSGLIDRSENPRNRRSSQLTLTPKGQTTLQYINENSDRFYRDFFDRIPPEKQAAMMDSIDLLAQLFSDPGPGKCINRQPCQPNINLEKAT